LFSGVAALCCYAGFAFANIFSLVMCDFQIHSSQKLICTESGQPISIHLLYGMFCDKLCGLDEAKEMFEQIKHIGKPDDNSGCDSNGKLDNPRKPTYIKTHLYPR